MIFEIEISDTEFSAAIRNAARSELGGGNMHTSSPFRDALRALVLANVAAVINDGTAAGYVRTEIERLAREITKEIVDSRLRNLIRQEMKRQLTTAEEQMKLATEVHT